MIVYRNTTYTYCGVSVICRFKKVLYLLRFQLLFLYATALKFVCKHSPFKQLLVIFVQAKACILTAVQRNTSCSGVGLDFAVCCFILR